ncbi:hypothetical protein EON67_05115 [archaeon]|nr:MAG: hypothetical protein EON67_05115 [archaeon]
MQRRTHTGAVDTEFSSGDYINLEGLLQPSIVCAKSVVCTAKSSCYTLSRASLITVVGSLRRLLARQAAADSALHVDIRDGTGDAPAHAPRQVVTPTAAGGAGASASAHSASASAGSVGEGSRSHHTRVSSSFGSPTGDLLSPPTLMTTHDPNAGSLELLQSKARPMDTSIKLEDLQRIVTVGVGTFGRVYMVRHVPSGQLFALKELKSATVERLNQTLNVQFELAVMGTLRHPFLLRLVNTYRDRRKLYMLTEYVQGGELFNLLGEMETLPVDHARFYASCVLSGLAHLHAIGIVYRDLKVGARVARAELRTRPCNRSACGCVVHVWPCARRLVALRCSLRTCSLTVRGTFASWISGFVSTLRRASARTPFVAHPRTLRTRWCAARDTRTPLISTCLLPTVRSMHVRARMRAFRDAFM